MDTSVCSSGEMVKNMKRWLFQERPQYTGVGGSHVKTGITPFTVNLASLMRQDL